MREFFMNAMMMWEKYTCIHFRLAKQSDKDYLVLRRGPM